MRTTQQDKFIHDRLRDSRLLPTLFVAVRFSQPLWDNFELQSTYPEYLALFLSLSASDLALFNERLERKKEGDEKGALSLSDCRSSITRAFLRSLLVCADIKSVKWILLYGVDDICNCGVVQQV